MKGRQGSPEALPQVCHLEKEEGRRIWMGKSLHLLLGSEKGLFRPPGLSRSRVPRGGAPPPAAGGLSSTLSDPTDGWGLSERPAQHFCLASCPAELKTPVPMLLGAGDRPQSSVPIVDCNKANGIVLRVTHLSLRITRVKVLLR